MILISTAGKVGSGAAHVLAQRGQPVRVLVRRPENAAAVAEDNAKALSLFSQGDADYITDDVSSLLGRPAITFEQFATDHANAFQ